MHSLYLAENRIERLKKRSRRCVCKYCGGKLILRRVVFNAVEDARVEIFCSDCDRIEFGVEPEIYESAKNFVDNFEFDYYASLESNEFTKKMNIAKVAEIIAWGCKNIGLINQEGFCVPVNMECMSLSECLTLTSEEIDTEKSFDELLEAVM